jgi:hypothetical protein
MQVIEGPSDKRMPLSRKIKEHKTSTVTKMLTGLLKREIEYVWVRSSRRPGLIGGAIE